MSIGLLQAGSLRCALWLCVLFLCGGGVYCAAQTPSDVDARDRSGQTALIRAAGKGDTATVNALIHAGANVNLADDTGQTALIAASTRLDTLRALIKAGADLNIRDSHWGGRTVLMIATDFGWTDVAKTLIEAGADVNIADNHERTALMHAAGLGRSEIVHTLIAGGANLNQRDENGTFPLMHAAWTCHEDIARELMKAGATVGPQEWLKKRRPQFEDFPVRKIYKGASAAVDLHSNTQAPTYRTRLRETAKQKADFAGHYIVADWGCGSNCQVHMVIDAITGKVFDGTGAERGVLFRLDSSLLIADPPDPPESVAYADNTVDSLPVRYLEWKNGKFSPLLVEVCSVSDGHQKCGCENVRELVLQAVPK
jgi:hypothetical protein